MSKEMFTPGPWAADNKPLRYFYRIYDSRDRLVATVPAGSTTKPSLTALPNLRLITAAPELYEALDAMLSEFNEQIPGIVHEELSAIHKARAALAKARGEQ